jgi:hypothetical protein
MNDTQAKSLSRAGLAAMVAAGLTTAGLTTLAAPANAADVLLSGTIASASGEKMGGVTVSAKAEGSVTTTTVYTDEAGEYYFPALPSGKYKVWAQAVSFETAKGDVDLSAAGRQDFKLSPLTDPNRQVRQLPGDMIYASLPEETAHDAHMKTLVKNNCTGCHTLSYILQHRFEEDGWYKVLELMKNVNVSGVNVAHERKVNAVVERHQKELAAYLARARSGRGSMKVKLPPGHPAKRRASCSPNTMLPLEESSPNKRPVPDGSDWTQKLAVEVQRADP